MFNVLEKDSLFFYVSFITGISFVRVNCVCFYRFIHPWFAAIEDKLLQDKSVMRREYVMWLYKYNLYQQQIRLGQIKLEPEKKNLLQVVMSSSPYGYIYNSQWTALDEPTFDLRGSYANEWQMFVKTAVERNNLTVLFITFLHCLFLNIYIKTSQIMNRKDVKVTCKHARIRLEFNFSELHPRNLC